MDKSKEYYDLTVGDDLDKIAHLCDITKYWKGQLDLRVKRVLFFFIFYLYYFWDVFVLPSPYTLYFLCPGELFERIV